MASLLRVELTAGPWSLPVPAALFTRRAIEPISSQTG